VEKVDGQAGDYEHYKNFVACAQRRQTPNADISIAHASNLVAHMGHIAHRLGNVALKFDPTRKRFGEAEANRRLQADDPPGCEIPEPV
jgi:hypothetical protein